MPKVEPFPFHKNTTKKFNNEDLEYSFEFKQNPYSVSVSRKSTGEKIFSSQVIADAGGTLDGEFAIGKNLLIAYMPWDGYNFEDAIVINEKLVATPPSTLLAPPIISILVIVPFLNAGFLVISSFSFVVIGSTNLVWSAC
jgi:hypothetical protein